MRRNQVRKLYREAILQVFGTGDTELDADLVKALKSDIHYGEEAPGGWSPSSVLEIYCESGIPNATDVHDFRAEAGIAEVVYSFRVPCAELGTKPNLPGF